VNDVAGHDGIAVLSGGGGWHVLDLQRAGAEIGVEVVPVDFRTLTADVGRGASVVCGVRLDNDRPVDLDRHTTAALVRTMPTGSLEEIIYRMDALHALEASGVTVLNPPRALECAIDKYLACVRLQAAGLPVPRTTVCEGVDAALGALERYGGRSVVLKPLFGSEGKDIVRIDSRDRGAQHFEAFAADGRVIYLQEFIEHGGADVRLFVLDGEILACMRRTAPSGGWVTNVARGGRATTIEPTPRQRELAVDATRAVGARVAGVDIVIDERGAHWVLEVNAVPGWRALSEVSGRDIARAVLESLWSRGRSTHTTRAGAASGAVERT